MEFENIISLSEKVKEAAAKRNVAFIGSMTTNAYLLTIDRLERLVSLNVTQYQITVDGLQETHDRHRFLAGGKGSWDVIMKNLLDAKKSGLKFFFSIRTNFDEDIYQNHENYLDTMSTYFEGDTRYSFYFEAIKKLGGENAKNVKDFNDEGSAMGNLINCAKAKGLKVSAFTRFTNAFGMICYAAKSGSLTVDYDGSIIKCTVALDFPYNNVGNISENGLSIKDHKMSLWTSRKLSDECLKCKIYAICYGKKCPLVGVDKTYCNKLLTIYENSLKAVQ